MTDILIFDTPQALATAAANQFIELANRAIAQKGIFNVALSGGSTPRKMFQLLASPEFASKIDWPHVHLFWGDERSVPPDHIDSNYRMTEEALLQNIEIPPANIHRIAGELSPQQAASQYKTTLQSLLGTPPVFDWILLGLGTDGHTASLFPQTEALQEKNEPVVPNFVPKMQTWRITLTAKTINRALHVTFLVSGKAKAAPLLTILHGDHHPELYPAQMIQPVSHNLTWLLDRDAAQALLKSHTN